MRQHFLVLFFILSAPLSAQQRIGGFIVYGKENGLGQSAYHDVFETSDGYLWAGSNDGLYKFDGRRFEKIINLYNNPNSPSDNNTVGFAEDNQGNLWIAGFTRGLTRYNLKTGKFKQYPRLSKDSTSGYALFCITKDSDGDLWIGTSGRGIARYLPVKDTFEFFYPDPLKHTDGSAYGENWVSGIVEDNSNKDILWLSAFDGVYQFNKRTKKFERFQFAYLRENKWQQVMAFFCTEQYADYLFMGTWFEGLIVFDKNKKTFERVPYQLPGKGPYQYGILDLQIADSTLYMAAMQDGLLSMPVSSRIIKPVLQTKDIKLTNTEINIQRVSLTPHAGFFAGGSSSIYQLSHKQNRFRNYFSFTAPKIIPGSLQDLFFMIYDRKNNGYWGTVFNYAGLLWYNNSFDKPVLYNNKPADKEEYFTHLVQDANGQLWCSSRYGSVFTFNPDMDKSPVRLTGKGADSVFTGKFFIEEIVSYDGRQVWFVSDRAAFLLDAAAGTITTFLYPAEKLKENSKEGIGFLNACADSKNNLWIATNIGLLKLEPGTKRISYFTGGPAGNTGLAGNTIKSITVDKNDNLWLGYFNEGLQVLDTRAMQVIHSFDIYNGLPSMEVNWISCDTANNMMTCFHNGLAIYNRAIKQWQQVNTLDGLKTDYLDVPVFAFSNGVNVLFQKENDFLVFASGDILNKTKFLATHISTVKVNGKPYEADQLPDYIQGISLPHSTRDIQIEFAATDWNYPFRTNYYYRVDGIHKAGEWLTRPEAAVTLTGLAPGHYTFRFYAITNDGVKTQERQLQIRIRPPYYRTWWFISLCAIAIAALLWGLYRYRINELKKLARIRNNISRDLHDDIGASLSNINILNELAKRNSSNPEKSKEYLDKAGEDIQRISEGLSDIVWNINPKYDSIENLFVRMKRYAADMLDGKNINGHYDFPGKADKPVLSMTQRRDFYLIFKEAVNNLAKYSGAANATVRVTAEDNTIAMLIKDDGKGFDINTIKPGNGLSNMEQRAKASGSVLDVESVPGEGTTVRLRMKIK